MFQSISMRAAMVTMCASVCFSFPAIAMPQDAPAPEASRNTAELPEAKKLIEDAIKAMGGRDAFKAIKSSMFKATIATPMGQANLEGYTAEGGKFLLKQSMAGMEQRVGSNGKVGWIQHPGGYELMPKEEAGEAQRQAEMHTMLLRINEDFTTMETVGRTEFQGKPCYKVRMAGKPGEENAEGEEDTPQFFFFGVEDKLLTGVEMTQTSPFGEMTSTMRFDEWKKKGDLNVFTRVRISQMGMDVTLNFTEVEFNQVDSAVFELPEQVKKLAEEAAPTPAAAP